MSKDIEDECWCIANVRSYIDGDDGCFVKEVPVSLHSEYMTYESDHFIEEATLYSTKEMAERLIECYHLADRVYKPVKVIKKTGFVVDPDDEFHSAE